MKQARSLFPCGFVPVGKVAVAVRCYKGNNQSYDLEIYLGRCFLDRILKEVFFEVTLASGPKQERTRHEKSWEKLSKCRENSK